MRVILGISGTCEHGRSWAIFSLAVLLLVAVPQRLFGQGFSHLSVPVPVDIDGQATRSQLYLKVEMKSYNLPFDQFAAGHPDKAEALFVKTVQAVRKNDVAAFGSVWSAPDEMKSTGQSKTVKLSDNGPDGWMKLILGMFDFDKLTVVAEILAGPDTMIIWDSQTKNGVLRRAFYVGPDKQGRVRLSAPGDDKPVQILLLNAFDAARTDPDSYKPLPNINLRYQYPIPLEGTSASSAHPVFLEFDGSPVDFPLADLKVEAPTPLLKFFRAAALANRSGNKEEFASSFTPKSQEKVKQWQATMEKRRESEKKTSEGKTAETTPPVSTPTGTPKAPLPKGPNVKFVLNADPVFLIFEAPGPGNDWTPAHLTYSYVVRDGASFKMANFGYGNTLDELLQDPALFDKRILKPATAKPGTPKTKTPPASAKPGAVKR
jgi:hypothetical protein